MLSGFATAIETGRKALAPSSGPSLSAAETGAVRIGWLTPLMGLIVAFDLISFWSIAWDVRDAIPPRYFSLLCALLVTGIYYLVARLAFPRERDRWPDYDVYYFAHKKLVLGGIVLCNLLASAGEWALGVNPFEPVFVGWAALVFYVLMLATVFAPAGARTSRCSRSTRP